MPLFKLWGTELRLHITFFLLALYLVLPEIDKGAPELLNAFLLSLFVLLAVVVHEIAHVSMAHIRKTTSRLSILLPTGVNV